MNTPLPDGRAVRYACAVLADCRMGTLPVDPLDLASRAGIMLIPLSQMENYTLWIPYDIADFLRMTCAVTLSYPAFCIVYRDTGVEPDRLRFALFHELGHIFMNHFRDYPELMGSARGGDSALEAEADLFGLSRSAWMRRLDSMDRDRAFVDEEMANVIIYLFHDFLLGRRCAACGKTFTDEKQANRCPFCGSTDLEWTL